MLLSTVSVDAREVEGLKGRNGEARSVSVVRRGSGGKGDLLSRPVGHWFDENILNAMSSEPGVDCTIDGFFCFFDGCIAPRLLHGCQWSRMHDVHNLFQLLPNITQRFCSFFKEISPHLRCVYV